MEILLSKYSSSLNPKLREVLLSTQGKILVEFERGAKKRQEKSGQIERWAGLVQDGILYGDNWMGQLLMSVRDQLLKGIDNPKQEEEENKEISQVNLAINLDYGDIEQIKLDLEESLKESDFDRLLVILKVLAKKGTDVSKVELERTLIGKTLTKISTLMIAEGDSQSARTMSIELSARIKAELKEAE